MRQYEVWMATDTGDAYLLGGLTKGQAETLSDNLTEEGYYAFEVEM